MLEFQLRLSRWLFSPHKRFLAQEMPLGSKFPAPSTPTGSKARLLCKAHKPFDNDQQPWFISCGSALSSVTFRVQEVFLCVEANTALLQASFRNIKFLVNWYLTCHGIQERAVCVSQKWPQWPACPFGATAALYAQKLTPTCRQGLSRNRKPQQYTLRGFTPYFTRMV